MITYRIDTTRSRFTVHAFAGGLLSFVAHSPTFAVQDYHGTVCFADDTRESGRIELSIRADSLRLQDNVKPADRQEIETRMRGEVLETAAYPEIRFEAERLTAQPLGHGEYRLHLDGRLSLHGMAQPHRMDARLLVYDDGLRASGETSLRLSDYRIKPVTAVGGAIKLKDQLRLVFDLVAWKEQ
jgi:polyisoprenoid-binding protein YceI